MRITLMADYECPPLWHAGGDTVGPIDPEALPLSEALQRDLWAWAARYDASLNPDDPAASGMTEADAAAFADDGRALWQRLQDELGAGYTVLFYDPAAQTLREPTGRCDGRPEEAWAGPVRTPRSRYEATPEGRLSVGDAAGYASVSRSSKSSAALLMQ